ncbi:nonstructural protein [Sigmofec virus UA08Rod_5746]|uniref:Nonstructural protein n=1 Tax=Sigmofec virus UA08Rod_5746 TaxID=2929439 RepID=A0A976N149_9VIRU|nr:nonstructural protein [Sigmofec virus UA08Rod_5746]
MSNVSTKEEFFKSHGVSLEEVSKNVIPSSCDCMYSLYDVCTGIFEAPFLSVNDSCAIRIVKDTILMRDNLVKRHPEDYQLFKLGLYDKSSGVVLPVSLPQKIVNLRELVTPNSHE